MPALSSKHNQPVVKLMMMGNSGAGKTGSLTSLVKAGYRLHILDFDNGLDSLIAHIRAECPDKIGNVDFMSFRDNYKMGPAGPMIVGGAKAYVSSAKALDKWEDGTSPASWGPEHIVVIDSLTSLGRAAFEWAKSMNPSAKEPRQWYFQAQDSIENILSILTGEEFRTNVIVLTHIDYIEDAQGRTEGFATAIGKALGPKIPRYFNTLLAIEKSGTGKSVKRKILSFPTATLTLKNPAPMKMETEYPIETGLATIFSNLSTQA